MIDVNTAAQQVHRALLDNTTFPDTLSQQFTLEQSYDVQFKLLEHRIAAGEKHVGWKVGLTSKAMQEQQGVHEPCLGHLMAEGHLQNPAQLEFGALMSPGFENELCLRLAKPLKGDVSFEEAHAAIDAIAPAIEIVEKRGVFAADLPLAFAGNAQQRAFITGEFLRLTPDIDLSKVEVNVAVNGEHQETACGAEVLGSPVNSVVWLAKKLSAAGRGLNPGDLIMSGSFTKQYNIRQGDKITASFAGLGDVSVTVE